MRICKFRLSGKTAFFKKPDVNTYHYFSYGNIHKVALLGIFGAILGYGGYNQMNKEDEFPEFYSSLKDIKLSIVPNNEKGIIHKKMQIFNNSVGYASKQEGGILNIKEFWLENPSWDIYFLIDSEEAERLSEKLLNHISIYQPYLGTNDHYADIEGVENMEIDKIENADRIDCLFPKSKLRFEYKEFDDEDDFEMGQFKYQENLPIGLDQNTNMYILDLFIYTNMKIECDSKEIYIADNKNLMFY